LRSPPDLFQRYQGQAQAIKARQYIPL